MSQRGPVSTETTTSPSQANGISPIMLPSAKRLAWLLVKDQEKLDESENALLRQLLRHPVVAKCHALAQQFTTMIRQRLPRKLTAWLSEIPILGKASRACGISEFASFAAGLQSDIAAVRAALEMEWSNGQLEGQVNRLKLIKRQMYGRANFDLLRMRVLSET